MNQEKWHAVARRWGAEQYEIPSIEVYTRGTVISPALLSTPRSRWHRHRVLAARLRRRGLP